MKNNNATTHGYIYIQSHACTLKSCVTRLYFIVFPSVIAQAKPEESTKNYSFAECETSHALLRPANRLQ
jgi:hypothetical protein